jgi:hypothetical protein
LFIHKNSPSGAPVGELLFSGNRENNNLSPVCVVE